MLVDRFAARVMRSRRSTTSAAGEREHNGGLGGVVPWNAESQESQGNQTLYRFERYWC